VEVPVYIRDAQIASPGIRYPWDEWKVNDYFLAIDAKQFERLDKLSHAANLALAVGSGEWICHRFSLLSDDPKPGWFLEASWAGIIHPAYCRDSETIDDEWRGPVRGPLNIAISIAHDGIHRLDTDPHEATRACWMYNLANHILPRNEDFQTWFEKCVLRFEQYHPFLESDDIWEQGPIFGIPVPREALDPATTYNPEDAPSLLDRFLQRLNPYINPFLLKAEELDGLQEFEGVPYRYLGSNL
jgi:hypothetical protein